MRNFPYLFRKREIQFKNKSQNIISENTQNHFRLNLGNIDIRCRKCRSIMVSHKYDLCAICEKNNIPINTNLIVSNNLKKKILKGLIRLSNLIHFFIGSGYLNFGK